MIRGATVDRVIARATILLILSRPSNINNSIKRLRTVTYHLTIIRFYILIDDVIEDEAVPVLMNYQFLDGDRAVFACDGEAVVVEHGYICN